MSSLSFCLTGCWVRCVCLPWVTRQPPPHGFISYPFQFAWNGDTAIASWGNTKSSTVPGMGYDGTDGDQPRGTVITNNFVHELGIWEKQSAFYFQAKTAQALLANNMYAQPGFTLRASVRRLVACFFPDVPAYR